MGLLSTLRELWTGPALTAASPVAPVIPSKPPTTQEGVSGVPNFGGRVVYEPIAALREQAGYGRSGGEWGFWEDLSAANSFVAAALDHCLAPVADCRVDVEAIPEALIGSGPGKVPLAVAEAMVELLRWNFAEKLQLQQHLAVSGRGFLKSGFALFEPTAAQAPDGRWYCAKLSERLPLSLHSSPWLETDDGTTLKAIRQQSMRGSRMVTVDLPAERVLLYVWQRQGTNWAGRSAFRAVQYIAGHVMPTLLKLIGVTLQREGAGIPVAEANDKDSPLDAEQRVALVELMGGLVFHESASAVMPAGWQLKWLFSGGANKGHVLEVWRELGTVVLQQLGAQQIQLGTSNTGSRSVGEVHDARSAAKVREVLRLQMAVLNGDDGEPFQGLGPRVCQWNFGAQAAYPRIKLTMQRPELPAKDTADAAAVLKGAGLLTPTLNDENTMRERIGLGPITEEERETERAASAARAPQLAPTSARPVEPDEDDEPDEKPLAASAQRAPWTPWRPLTAAEERMNLPALDAYFTAQRDAFEARAKALALGMLAKATPAIHAAMADGKVTPAEVAGIPLDSARLKAYLADFVDAQRTAGRKSVEAEQMAKPLLAAAEDEQDDKLGETAEADADEVTTAQVDALERKVLSRIRGELERESVDALRTGDDAAGVVERVISRQLDSGAFRSDAGYVVTKAFNVGRDEAARIMGGIASVTYSAILDSATCEACQADDGKTAAFGSDEHDELLPPNRDCAGGDNCRCLLAMNPEGDE